MRIVYRKDISYYRVCVCVGGGHSCSLHQNLGHKEAGEGEEGQGKGVEVN